MFLYNTYVIISLMKLSQAVKLGHQSLTAHRRRSLSIIITMSVLFGLLFGVNFVIQGLENIIIGAANRVSNGEYYVEVNTNPNLCQSELFIPEDAPPYSETTCPKSDLVGDLTSLVEQYHGQFISIDESPLATSDVSNLIQYDLSQLPGGVIPVITDLRNAFQLYGMNIKSNNLTYLQSATLIEQAVPDILGRVAHHPTGDFDYAVVGIIPSNNIEELYIKRRSYSYERSSNPLDLILAAVSGGSAGSVSGVTILGDSNAPWYNALPLDNGTELSASAQDIFAGLYQSHYDNYRSAIVKFTSLTDVRHFIEQWQTFTPFTFFSGSSTENLNPYLARQIFTGQINFEHSFAAIKWFISFLELIIIAIAFIIIIFTCLKVIAAEAATIRLYRSLGASAGNIWLIYGWYLLELCLMSIAAAMFIGAIIALIASALNAFSLSQMLTAAFSRPYVASTILLGWNCELTSLALVMLLAAPICLLLCLPKLLKAKP